MKKLILFASSLSLISVVLAEDLPSERLLDSALADHFARNYCLCKFPDLRGEILRAYNSSMLRVVTVPCNRFECSDAEHTRGMQRLLKAAQQEPESEAREISKSYGEALHEIEVEHEIELKALYRRANQVE